jgi:hypothetical protein
MGAIGDEAPASFWTAREILERAQENWTRTDTAARIRLRVVSRSGRAIEHRIESTRRSRDGDIRTLIRLTHPPDLRDTTLLILGNQGRADDLFLYLPARRRVLRIPAPRRGDRFLGTDLTFEDVGGSIDLEDYRLRRLPLEHLGGEEVWVVHAEPKVGPGDVRRYRIARRTFVVLGVDYERHGRLIQRLDVEPESVRRVASDTWLPTRLVMRNLVTGSRTELELESLDVDPDLPAEFFSVSRLERLARKGLLGTDGSAADSR